MLEMATSALFKVNWDGATNVSSKTIGLGGVVRDFGGAIHAFVCSKLHFLSKLVAFEALALHRVL